MLRIRCRNWVWIPLAVVGCDPSSGETDGGQGGAGNVTVLVDAEDLITEGIPATDGPDGIRDGWSVMFERYVVVIGDIDIHLATDERVAFESPSRTALDLAQVPPTGTPVATLEDVPRGRWEFFYGVEQADASTLRHASVRAAELDEMIANGWSYLIEGVLAQSGGVSCPPPSLASPGDSEPVDRGPSGDPCYANPNIRFRFGTAEATRYGPCELDEIPGFVVTDGAASTVAASIHGDHLFFNGFPESAESGVTRLAQWLADCDLDLDGEVTRDELERITPGDLAELDQRFQLGGSPIAPLATVWTYVEAQLKTQGHFQGEGECALDGLAHGDP